MIAPAHPLKHRLPPRRSLIERPDANRTAEWGESNVVQRIVGKHPIVAVTVAGMVGITIGCLVKRRND